MRRYKCEMCGWLGDEFGILRAPHPFKRGEELEGCPNCRGINCFDLYFIDNDPGGDVRPGPRKTEGK